MKWDRTQCQEKVCTCHDDSIVEPYFCSGCGCQPTAPAKHYTIQHNIGKAKYVVNFHDGHAIHQDGSPFHDIKIFTSHQKMNQFLKQLYENGYTQQR